MMVTSRRDWPLRLASWSPVGWRTTGGSGEDTGAGLSTPGERDDLCSPGRHRGRANVMRRCTSTPRAAHVRGTGTRGDRPCRLIRILRRVSSRGGPLVRGARFRRSKAPGAHSVMTESVAGALGQGEQLESGAGPGSRNRDPAGTGRRSTMQATSTGIVLTAWERRRNRVLVVAVVVAAAVALWAVYHLALGIDLRA